ncbi:MAG TPA: hypothetical protein VKU44_02490 [Terriglobia bacterium]|jgi:hypothetical protein|nr:hypothetical protein [Terriglobia bacterium]
MKSLHLLALGSLLGASLMLAQTTPSSSSSAAKPATTSSTAKSKTPATPPPSAADIASAKAKGLVWVNTNTKVYHFSTDSHYGTTKAGKFMAEADAKAAGYRAAKDASSKAKTGGTGASK